MWRIYYDGKVTLRRFGFFNLHQDFMPEKNYYLDNDRCFYKMVKVWKKWNVWTLALQSW